MNTINLEQYFIDHGLPGNFTLLNLSNKLNDNYYPLTLDFTNVYMGMMDIVKIFKPYSMSHTIEEFENDFKFIFDENSTMKDRVELVKSKLKFKVL